MVKLEQVKKNLRNREEELFKKDKLKLEALEGEIDKKILTKSLDGFCYIRIDRFIYDGKIYYVKDIERENLNKLIEKYNKEGYEASVHVPKSFTYDILWGRGYQIGDTYIEITWVDCL